MTYRCRCSWPSGDVRGSFAGAVTDSGSKVGEVEDSEGELTRQEALDRIRQMRRQLRGADPESKIVEVTGGPPEADSANPDDAPLETLQLKYEMELAAHRDTTTALLAEKDRTIAGLEDLVAELRRQAQHGQQHLGDSFDHR